MSVSTTTSISRAQEIAEEFIKHFSQEQEVDTVTSPWFSLINGEQKDFLAAEMKVYYQNRARYEEDWWRRTRDELMEGSGFYQFVHAKHYDIWGHRDFPKVVFKHMTLESAQQHAANAKKVHGFVITQKPFWCQAPVVEVVALPKYADEEYEMAFYVEEELPLKMNAEEYIEFWDRIYVRLHSSECVPVFKENMSQLVQQMCTLIENTDFWDVGCKNFPEVSVDGKHLCITDFVGIEKPNAGEGIRRLAGLFDYSPFVEYISERYEQVGVLKDLEVWNKDSMRKTEEELRADFYRSVKVNQEGNPRFGSLGSTARRKKLAEQMNIQL